jgi:hypothetical protein
MFFNFTTNEHHPLLGMIRAIFGLREVGLEAENFVPVFASDDIDTLLCVGLYTGNASVRLHFDAFDALIGFTFDVVGSACRLSQLIL